MVELSSVNAPLAEPAVDTDELLRNTESFILAITDPLLKATAELIATLLASFNIVLLFSKTVFIIPPLYVPSALATVEPTSTLTKLNAEPTK